MRSTNVYILFFSIIISLLFTNCKKKEKEEQADCTEKVRPECICTQEYAPVCGCNNKTYSNPCTAACSGISKYTQGECQ